MKVRRRGAPGSVLATGLVASLLLTPAALAEPGDVYVLDRAAGGDQSGVIEIDPDTGEQRPVSIGGLLERPSGIAVDPFDGSLVVSNEGDASVIRIDSDSGEQELLHRGPPLVSPRDVRVGSRGRATAIRVIDPGAEPQSLAGFGAGNIFNSTKSGGFSPYELDYVEAPFVEMTALENGYILDRRGGSTGTGALYFVGETCYEGDTSVYCEDGQELDSEGGEFLDPVGLGYLGARIGAPVVVDTGGAGGGRLIKVSGGDQELLATGGELVDPTDLDFLPARAGFAPRALVTDPGAADGTGALLSVDPETGAQTVAGAGGSLADPVAIAIDLESCLDSPISQLTEIGSDDDDRIVIGSPEQQLVHSYGGSDLIRFEAAPESGGIHRACGGADGDMLRGSPGPDTLDGGAGPDRLRGGGDEDFMLGRGGGDHLDGGAGYDDLNGGPGPDELRGGAGAGYLNGGPGGDLLTGGSDREIYRGGDGPDRIKAADGSRRRDKIECGDGRDRVVADRRDRVDRDCEKVRIRRR